MSAADKPPPNTIDESALRGKLLIVPSVIVEKALILYVILTDGHTPLSVRALVVAALIYLLDPLDCVPDFIPGVGFTDDLAVMAVTLERLSRFVTPRVKLRAKRLAPHWLTGREEHDSQPQTATRSNTNNEQGVPHDGEEKENDSGRRRVPFLERFRILP